MSLPPANWYPAPDDPSRESWWNGAEWSDNFRAAGPPAVPAAPAYAQPQAYAPAYAQQPYNPVYQQQAYGAAPAAKNGLATAGMIVSIVSVLIGLYGVVCIVGIALSGAGLGKARQAEAATGVAVGKSAATAGIAIGIISLVLNVIWIAWVANNPYFFRF